MYIVRCVLFHRRRCNSRSELLARSASGVTRASLITSASATGFSRKDEGRRINHSGEGVQA